MRDDTSTPAADRPGATLLSGAIAAAGAVAMGTSVGSLHELARTSQGSETLIIWVLLGLAGLGAMLCLYLALIWGLAAMILAAGPASRTGAALLGPLRILAPRVARRLTSGAVVATAATALTLSPGMASQDLFETDPAVGTAPAAQSAELLPMEASPTDPAPDAVAPASSDQGAGNAGTGDPLPPLGWGGSSAPTATENAAPAAAAADGTDRRGPSPDSVPRSTAPAPMRTVVVHRGDSLWSISEDLLGPGASAPAEIAAAWPLLHETNRDVIGDDPDRLRPGQQLTVPTALTTQDKS